MRVTAALSRFGNTFEEQTNETKRRESGKELVRNTSFFPAVNRNISGPVYSQAVFVHQVKGRLVVKKKKGRKLEGGSQQAYSPLCLVSYMECDAA